MGIYQPLRANLLADPTVDWKNSSQREVVTKSSTRDIEFAKHHFSLMQVNISREAFVLIRRIKQMEVLKFSGYGTLVSMAKCLA